MSPRYRRYLIILSALTVLLVGAICAETYQIRRLSHKLRATNMQPATEISKAMMKNAVMDKEGNSINDSESPAMNNLKELIQAFNEDSCSILSEMQQVREQIALASKGLSPQIVTVREARPTERPRSAFPHVDLRDEGSRYIVRVDLPGLDKTDINAQVDGEALIISGQREEARPEKEEQGKLVRNECFCGNFERRIALPEPVQGECGIAKYENGVLTVLLPKGDTEVEMPPRILIE